MENATIRILGQYWTWEDINVISLSRHGDYCSGMGKPDVEGAVPSVLDWAESAKEILKAWQLIVSIISNEIQAESKSTDLQNKRK